MELRSMIRSLEKKKKNTAVNCSAKPKWNKAIVGQCESCTWLLYQEACMNPHLSVTTCRGQFQSGVGSHHRLWPGEIKMLSATGLHSKPSNTKTEHKSHLLGQHNNSLEWRLSPSCLKGPLYWDHIYCLGRTNSGLPVYLFSNSTERKVHEEAHKPERKGQERVSHDPSPAINQPINSFWPNASGRIVLHLFELSIHW